MLKRTVMNILSPGVWNALKTLRSELGLAYRHRKALAKAARYRGKQGNKVNFGSGANVKAGWINVDLNKEADLALDLRRPLPFETESCSLIYSEHLLEHLEYPGETLQFLKECFRVLEPEGVFSVGVPDTEWYMLDYCGVENQSRKLAGFPDEDVFSLAKRLWHPSWCQTRMEHLHHHARQGGEHQFAYDLETLSAALRRAGFAGVERRDFDPKFDSPSRRLNTLTRGRESRPTTDSRQRSGHPAATPSPRQLADSDPNR